jgi:hypothetical protein
VHNGLPYKRGRKCGVPPRRVLGLKVQRQEAIKALHDEIGHRGVMSTFEYISRRY